MMDKKVRRSLYGALLRSRRIHPPAGERYLSADGEITTCYARVRMSCVMI